MHVDSPKHDGSHICRDTKSPELLPRIWTGAGHTPGTHRVFLAPGCEDFVGRFGVSGKYQYYNNQVPGQGA